MAISSKPYLVRAIHAWALDCELTPHILCATGYDGFEVPNEYISDGQILFNLSPSATRELVIGDGAVEFLANFAQKVSKIRLPMESVIAIYAYENGEGITFDEQDQLENMGIVSGASEPFNIIETTTNDEKQDVIKEKEKPKKAAKPTLKIIK